MNKKDAIEKKNKERRDIDQARFNAEIEFLKYQS